MGHCGGGGRVGLGSGVRCPPGGQRWESRVKLMCIGVAVTGCGGWGVEESRCDKY